MSTSTSTSASPSVNVPVTRELFGGAITIDIPPRFEDVSQFRQVPNHQEVFSDADTDQSIIIELNSMAECSSDELPTYYLEDLSTANEAKSSNMMESRMMNTSELPHFSNVPSLTAYRCIYHMEVAKFKEHAYNALAVFVAIIRIPSITTDILLIFNVPTAFDPQSSSAGRKIVSADENTRVVDALLKSLHIKDWGLFKQDEDVEM